MLLPVVIAGGIGARLWPISRTMSPKQFIDFPGLEGSLFQNTIARLGSITGASEPLIVCNLEHRFLVAEQLRNLNTNHSKILLEPFARNTAPATAMASLLAIQSDPDALLLVLPSDHHIKDLKEFASVVREGEKLALQDHLVTFGVPPSSAETGYGYIEIGDKIDSSCGYKVSNFVEKPDKETAESYLQSSSYYWNSGMFMFSARRYLEDLKTYASDIHDSCVKAFGQVKNEGDFLKILEADFEQCRSDSIDYAVMENTPHAAMIPFDVGWSDLGSWDALWDFQHKNESGNILDGDVIAENVKNSFVQSNSRLLAVVGIDDAVIVETPDSVLVSNRSSVQNVKQIVEKLEDANRNESKAPKIVLRPWGSYESIVKRKGYQVKHIIVRAGESLSLQMHRRRSEHWTVVKGKGVVTCDDQETTLELNESIFIPLGSKHRLANPFAEPVEIIEVQIGDYLGEDDIERFDDQYGRVE